MQCGRCQGIMVVDYFLDMESSDEVWMPGWRCLTCGEVIDPLILNHRHRQAGRSAFAETTSHHTPKRLNPLPILSGKSRKPSH